MKNYKNILIIQTAFIGDAILASSLIEKLHAFFPNASISILVKLGNESIFNEHPFLKDVLVWNKKQNKTKHFFKLIYQVRKNKYDCVINCHRFASSGLLTAFSNAKHTCGYKENPFSFLFNVNIKHNINSGLHETERYNQLIKDFTNDVVYKPKLYPSLSDKEFIKPFLNNSYICIAPASVWFTKQLPVNKWIELCDKLDSNTFIYLLGAENDTIICNKIKEASKNKNIEVLAGKVSLLQSCELMKHAKMNYVNDSAPLHLASSSNSPTTAFFISTIPQFGFGPLAQNSTIIEVLNLECRPCGIHGHNICPKKHFNCANQIKIPEITF